MKVRVSWRAEEGAPEGHCDLALHAPKVHTFTNSITEAWMKSLLFLCSIFTTLGWHGQVNVLSHPFF